MDKLGCLEEKYSTSLDYLFNLYSNDTYIFNDINTCEVLRSTETEIAKDYDVINNKNICEASQSTKEKTTIDDDAIKKISNCKAPQFTKTLSTKYEDDYFWILPVHDLRSELPTMHLIITKDIKMKLQKNRDLSKIVIKLNKTEKNP